MRAADRSGADWAVIRQAPERARGVAVLRPLRAADTPQREADWSAFLAGPRCCLSEEGA